MKINSLIGALAVLSLIVAPALSQPILKGCECMPEDCPGKPAENCCSKSSDNNISTSCSCTSMMASYSGLEYYDPGYSNFSKTRITRSSFADRTSTSNDGAFSPISAAAPDKVGPPDPDVVEYLPPSAKQVFLALASGGSLTQKEIINKTDLPPRTVRYALGRLRGEEMLEERFCFRDARQSLYSLNGLDTR